MSSELPADGPGREGWRQRVTTAPWPLVIGLTIAAVVIGSLLVAAIAPHLLVARGGG